MYLSGITQPLNIKFISLVYKQICTSEIMAHSRCILLNQTGISHCINRDSGIEDEIRIAGYLKWILVVSVIATEVYKSNLNVNNETVYIIHTYIPQTLNLKVHLCSFLCYRIISFQSFLMQLVYTYMDIDAYCVLLLNQLHTQNKCTYTL